MLLAALVAVLTPLVLAQFDACSWRYLCGPIVAEDIMQSRLDTALSAPRPDLAVEQTFVSRHDGLREVELILVRFGGESAALERDSVFTVQLLDDSGASVAAESLPTAGITHNQLFTLVFPPQPRSAGRLYTLRLSGSEANQISAWGYALDVYSAGELRFVTDPSGRDAPANEARELRFVTRYALTAGEALTAALAPLRHGALVPVALLFLPLPGIVLLLWFRPRGWDGAAWCGAALALGLGAWPLIWYCYSLAGGRWSGALLWGLVGVGWGAIAAVAGWRWIKRERDRGATDRTRKPIPAAHWALAILLLVTLASRFIAVRGLAFPPWVDSSRHGLITAVMVEQGRTPQNYEPLLPVGRFPYHFGFHTLSASLIMMTGEPLAQLLLDLMQLLSGFLPLTVYAAGWIVTRRRSVGLLAAFLVALPFFFPGYYATWGRMTQLTAMMILPVLLALTWQLGRGWSRFWPLVSLLAAGLFLTHFRVFLFYILFAGLAAAFHWLRYRRVAGLLKAAGLGALLVLSRILELWIAADPLNALQRSQTGYNDFPIGYVTTGWERAYLIVALPAVVYVAASAARRRSWAEFPLLLTFWVGGLFALLAGGRLGLPETLIVNLNSMYITLFLPLALLLAIVGVRGWERLIRSRPAARYRAIRVAGAVTAGIVLGSMALFGWRQQIGILNRQTILALQDDVPSLMWIGSELPPQARIAVNAWRWSGATWAGSDAGAWITPLTGHMTSTPPVDHIYNRELFADVRGFNETAMGVSDWSDSGAAAWLAEQGITHVYAGTRGGYFDPAQLSRNPALELLFQRDGTFVFAVKPP